LLPKRSKLDNITEAPVWSFLWVFLLTQDTENSRCWKKRVEGTTCCDGCPYSDWASSTLRHYRQESLTEISPAVQTVRTVLGHIFSGTKQSRPCLTRS